MLNVSPLRFLVISFLLLIFTKSNGAVYYVTNSGAAGYSELVSGINQANATAALDTIYFNIQGQGPFMIPFSTTPLLISHPILVDGLSQAGNDTSAWLIQFSGNSFFQINSSNIRFTGIKFIGLSNSFAKAFIINNDSSGVGGYIHDLDFNRNHFVSFKNVFEFDLVPANFYVSLRYIYITDNYFFYNLDVIRFASGLQKFQNITFSNNFLVYTRLRLVSGIQTQPDRFKILTNEFYNSMVEGAGRYSISQIIGNEFYGSSKISLTLTAPDSVIISQNVFMNMDHAIYIQLYSGQSQKIYITGNSFHCVNKFGVRIHETSIQTVSDWNGIFVSNNEFYNTWGISIDATSPGGISTISDFNILNNYLKHDTTGFIGDLIDIYVDDERSVDGFRVDGNEIDGACISFNIRINGTAPSGNTFDRVSISKNKIINSDTYPGIYFRSGIGGSFSDLLIDSNHVSNSAGGFVYFHNPYWSSLGSLSNMHITNNTFRLNQSYGIDLLLLPSWDGNSLVDSIVISGNTLDSNQFDGLRIQTNMVYQGYSNQVNNIHVEQNIIKNNLQHGISYIHNGTTQSIYQSPILTDFTFTRNQIYDNNQKGISLVNLGDPAFPASPIHPTPVVQSIVDFTGNYEVSGIVQGQPSSPYLIELFENNLPDPSGYGEGALFLTDQVIFTDSQGEAFFQIPVNGSPAGKFYSVTGTNLNTGNTSEFSNSADLTVGITSVQSHDFLNIYPNPVKDYFILSCSSGEQFDVEIIDQFGRVAISRNVNVSTRFNASELVPGLYIIKVLNSEGAIRTHKIIKTSDM